MQRRQAHGLWVATDHEVKQVSFGVLVDQQLAFDLSPVVDAFMVDGSQLVVSHVEHGTSVIDCSREDLEASTKLTKVQRQA